MHCAACGQGPPLWTYESEGRYRLEANWLDERTLQAIAEHALAMEPPLDAIYIDICRLTLADCEACFLRQLRTNRGRLEREYGFRGLAIHYYY